jgi:hypothetical protein
VAQTVGRDAAGGGAVLRSRTDGKALVGSGAHREELRLRRRPPKAQLNQRRKRRHRRRQPTHRPALSAHDLVVVGQNDLALLRNPSSWPDGRRGERRNSAATHKISIVCGDDNYIALTGIDEFDAETLEEAKRIALQEAGLPSVDVPPSTE